MQRFFLMAVAALASVLATGAASAHPHVWVTMQSELVYAPDGSVTGVRHAWTFDDMFSAFAMQGIEAKKKGEYTREELAPLAEVNVTSLKEYDFFTQGLADGKKVEFSEPPAGYYLAFDKKDAVLTLHFVLPLKAPVKAKDLSLEIFDREFFVDFSFKDKEPAKLVGAPAGCKLVVGEPQDMGAELSQRLSQLGPRPARSLADHRCRVRQQDFGEMPMKVVAGVTPRLAKLLVVVRGHPAGGGRRRCRVGARRTVRRAASASAPPPPAGGVLGWIFAKQAEFYRAAFGRDPRRQGRRQRGLDPVRHLVPLRHVSCRRARSRQGGDLVLRRRQRGDLEARRGAVVRLGAAAGAGRGGDRRHRGGAVERDRRHDEPCGRRRSRSSATRSSSSSACDCCG